MDARRPTRQLGQLFRLALQEPVKELLVGYAEQRQCAHLRSICVGRCGNIRTGVLFVVGDGAGGTGGGGSSGPGGHSVGGDRRWQRHRDNGCIIAGRMGNGRQCWRWRCCGHGTGRLGAAGGGGGGACCRRPVSGRRCCANGHCIGPGGWWRSGRRAGLILGQRERRLDRCHVDDVVLEQLHVVGNSLHGGWQIAAGERRRRCARGDGGCSGGTAGSAGVCTCSWAGCQGLCK